MNKFFLFIWILFRIPLLTNKIIIKIKNDDYIIKSTDISCEIKAFLAIFLRVYKRETGLIDCNKISKNIYYIYLFILLL